MFWQMLQEELMPRIDAPDKLMFFFNSEILGNIGIEEPW